MDTIYYKKINIFGDVMDFTADFIFYMLILFLLALFFGYIAAYFFNKAYKIENSSKSRTANGKHHHNVILTFIFGFLAIFLYYLFIVTIFEVLDKSNTQYACIGGLIHVKDNDRDTFFIDEKYQNHICKSLNQKNNHTVYNGVILEKLYYDGKLSFIGIRDVQNKYPIFIAKGFLNKLNN